MGIERVIPNVKGFKGDAPYLGRISNRFPDFSRMILLVTKESTTILVGEYTGTREDLRETYTSGASFPSGEGIALGYITPLNKERGEGRG